MKNEKEVIAGIFFGIAIQAYSIIIERLLAIFQDQYNRGLVCIFSGYVLFLFTLHFVSVMDRDKTGLGFFPRFKIIMVASFVTVNIVTFLTVLIRVLIGDLGL